VLRHALRLEKPEEFLRGVAAPRVEAPGPAAPPPPAAPAAPA